MFRNTIQKEYHSVLNQIEQIRCELNMLPKGKLLISQDGIYRKWYVSDGHVKTYIPKKKRNYAEQLAQKKYLTERLKRLQSEERALYQYLQVGEEDMIPSDSEYAKLLSAYFDLENDEHKRWADEAYDRNLNYPEHLIHKTSSGILVRSKSEAMIEHFLHTNRIPFRYECALYIDHVTFYPDFTIMHPKTKKIYYWEHFGRMDDIGYAEKTYSKLRTYAVHGLVPSIQLITTYETKRNPISYEDIERIGTQYFLE